MFQIKLLLHSDPNQQQTTQLESLIQIYIVNSRKNQKEEAHISCVFCFFCLSLRKSKTFWKKSKNMNEFGWQKQIQQQQQQPKT